MDPAVSMPGLEEFRVRSHNEPVYPAVASPLLFRVLVAGLVALRPEFQERLTPFVYAEIPHSPFIFI